MAHEDDESNVSDDTLAHLQAAKKGKPRRFVIITRGPAVQSLIAYKNGSLPSQIKRAKDIAAGRACYGVVSGKGIELTFKLSREDGFEKPPVRDVAIKAFLADLDFRCKPEVVIVDQFEASDKKRPTATK